MRFALRLLPFAIVPALFDCASLPSLSAGTCGNGVVDANEDCDTFPSGQCIPPGAANQCRLDCSGTTSCPAGWGCDTTSHICNSPSGSFVAASDSIAAGAWRVSIGDFDGDGLKDVLTRAVPDATASSKLRVHFFDRSYALAKAIVIPPSLASPSVLDVDGDKRDDITFNSPGAVGTFLGRADRTLSPLAYPTNSFTGGTARFVAVHGKPDKRAAYAVILSDGTKTALLALNENAPADLLLVLNVTPDSLAGDLQVANVITNASPCDEIIFAPLDADTVRVFPACKHVGATIDWNKNGTPIDIALPAGVHVDPYGARVADIDGDGNLDVLVGGPNGTDFKKETTFIAYGDGAGNFRSAPFGKPGGQPGTFGAFQIPTAGFGESYSPHMPLAIGDVSGDGKPDFVTADQVLTSYQNADGGTTFTEWIPAQSKEGSGTWSQAAIADFNGNGFPDIIAATKNTLDLDLFSGTGTPLLNTFSISTQGAPHHFALGDVDGDLLPDLVFAEASGSNGDSLAIVFGQVGGAPFTPAEVGRFETIDQTSFFVGEDRVKRPVRELAVISHAVAADGKPVTEIALLAATGDRQPLALRSLDNSMGGVGAPVLASAPGPFAGGAQAVAGVAVDVASKDTAVDVWMLQGTELASAVQGPPLPLTVDTTRVDAVAHVLTAAAPFTGDGTEELAIIANVAPATTSVLVLARPKAADAQLFTFDLRAQVPLDRLISREGQLAAVDVDRDGATDLVLLTGANSGPRSIVVLWNDRQGNFDPARSTVVVPEAATPDGQPQGFGFATTSTTEPPVLAYVTHTAVFLAHVDPQARRLSVDNQPIARLTGGGSGIAGGDLNGDGVDDLVAVDSGNLVILAGQTSKKNP